MDVLTRRSFHGQDISVIFSPEAGRWLGYVHTAKLTYFLDDCRYNHTDWMRGQGEPPGWEDRFSIDREQWSETWLLYERDLMIQEDLEWFAEAVYQFYQKHLDRLIRENNMMWGDFCKKKYDDDGNEIGLELNTWGYDMTDPDVEVPITRRPLFQIQKPTSRFKNQVDGFGN